MMEQKVYMNYVHPSSLLKQLSDLWKADQLCDAVITVDKIIVNKAHKVVLFAVSPKLKADSISSSQSPILDVCLPSGVSHKSVHAFLKYIYEGYLILTKQLAVDLLKISKFLRIKCLTNCCNDYLKSLEAEENVLVLDDEPKEINTEDLEHVRSSAVEATQLITSKRQNEDSDCDKISVKSKRPRVSQDVPSPSRTFRQSQRTDSGGLSADSQREDSSDVQYIVHSVDSGDTDSESSRDRKFDTPRRVKSENAESCAGASGGPSWTARHDNELSNQDAVSPSFPGEISLTDVKEEPHDLEADSNFFQNISSASTSTPSGNEQSQFEAQSMWFSESGAVETFSQEDGSMDNQMAAQRGMPPFSLSQMRAQQSIKRSIQSSVSAARRARNVQPLNTSGDTEAQGLDDSTMYDEGQDVGNDSQSQEVDGNGTRTNTRNEEIAEAQEYASQMRVLLQSAMDTTASLSNIERQAATPDCPPDSRLPGDSTPSTSKTVLSPKVVLPTKEGRQRNPSFNQLLSKINRKMELLDKHQAALERKVGRLSTATSSSPTPDSHQEQPIIGEIVMPVDVPEKYYIPPETLEHIYKNSMGVGNFAKRLATKLFPELFGPDNLRAYFSYNGGGLHKKQALDPVGKDVLRRYVLMFRPDYDDPVLYKEVVNSINEGLRRPTEKKKRLLQHSKELSFENN